MVPSLLFDITGFDLSSVQHGVEAIERVNPQRGAMRMLDGVVHASEDFGEVVAFKDVREDEFWVEGHIPGRPLFPGVMMVEAAAQLAAYLTLSHLKEEAFLGFVGADAIKFRGQVVPGDRLVLLGKLRSVRRRRAICDTQGLVGGRLVYEGVITGTPL